MTIRTADFNPADYYLNITFEEFTGLTQCIVAQVSTTTGDIAAHFDAGEPGGERRHRAARGAPRRQSQVPRVVGGSVNGVEALRVREPDRHVGLAEHDGAGAEPAIDRERVASRDVVFQFRDAPGGGQTFDIERFFDRHGHAMQRSPNVAVGERPVGGFGALACFRNVGDDDRV